MTDADNAEDLSKLLDGLRGADTASLEELWARHGPIVAAIVEKRWARPLRGAEGTDDVLQSIFRTLFRVLKDGSLEFDDAREFTLLLYGIARNKIAEKVRHYRTQARDHRKQVPLPTATAGQTVPWEPAAPAEPEHLLEPEMQAALTEVIQTLAERPRRAVLLRLEGKTTDDIALELGVSDRAVRGYLAKAIRTLRTRLHEPTP